MKIQITAAHAIRRSLKRMGGLKAAEIDEVVFHLLDWEKDLAQYAGFVRAPSKYNDDEISALLIRFLVHVPAHVTSAAEILLKLGDERRPAQRGKFIRTRRRKRKNVS